MEQAHTTPEEQQPDRAADVEDIVPSTAAVAGAGTGAAGVGAAAAAGAVAGLPGGPAGAIAGAIVGAALGGAGGEVIKSAADDEEASEPDTEQQDA